MPVKPSDLVVVERGGVLHSASVAELKSSPPLPETKTLGYAGGNLTAVTSDTGKSITLAYSNGRLTTVTAVFAGKTVTKTLTYLADGQTINKITTVVT